MTAPAPRRSRQPYSGWEDHLITVWDKMNMKPKEMARRTSRGDRAIETRRAVLRGLQVARGKTSKPESVCEKAKRKCLMCGAKFMSNAKAHRICHPCKGSAVYKGGDGGDFSVSGVRV